MQNKMAKTKPNGFWQKEENAIAEARKLMEEHGFETLPSSEKLWKLGYSSLSTAITQYHGGISNFRKLLGEKPKRTEHGKWRSLEYTIQQAQEFMESHEFETLPSQGNLQKLRYSSLSQAIRKYHGGFHKFRKLLGEQPKRTEMGQWRSLEYTIQQAQEIKQKHGLKVIPSANKLIKLGYSSLNNAIQKYHGGYHNFRKLLGEQPKVRKMGQWRSLEYTIQQAQEFMETHGFKTIPCGEKLRKLGYSSFATAITKYHGGFRNVRNILGEKQKRIENDLWKNLEYALHQAQEFMESHEFETLPSQGNLQKLRYSSLSTAITKYHGGFHKFRKLLGERKTRVEMGSWKSIDYTIQQAQEFMEKHRFETLPDGTKLAKLGYSSLSAAISQYHGGFHKFRKLLGEELTRRESGIWKSIDYTIQQAQEFMEKHRFETLPAQINLEKLGYSSLSHAIRKYHGGFPTFRATLVGKTPPSEKEKLTALVRKYAE